MKVFITGIAGFLGSWLADHFKSEGHQVVGCDNLKGGTLGNLPDDVNFYLYDITEMDLQRYSKMMEGCDVWYHCAAMPYEGVSVFAPGYISDNIFSGSVNTFTAAIMAGVKRIVYCSSMARYGTNKTPFKESLTPKPQDPYGIAKEATERVLKNMAHVHGIEYVIAVPHNIYGPRQKYDDPYRNVASIMANLMLQDRYPIIYGDGSQIRCFSYIDDCIACLAKCATLPNVVGETINIGPDSEDETVTILDAESWKTIVLFNEGPTSKYTFRHECHVGPLVNKLAIHRNLKIKNSLEQFTDEDQETTRSSCSHQS